MKKRAYEAAIRDFASEAEIERLRKEWEEVKHLDEDPKLRDMLNQPLYYVNGFQHPYLYTLIKDDQLHASRFQWGLVPHWVKNKDQAQDIWNKTLNARGESIFEKPSFRDAAKDKRCLIVVDGFYEYHHQKGKTFPFYFERKDDLPVVFGGLWSEWVDKGTGEIWQTATIVTTEGNELMKKIHNNPKAKGARMPLILDPDDYEIWLSSKDKESVKKIIKPYKNGVFKTYPVGKLKGKDAIGNDPKAQEKHEYPELVELLKEVEG